MVKIKFQISNWTRLVLAATLLASGVAFALTDLVGAQESELRLSLSRDWGFSAGGQIQGLFTLSVGGAQDIESVRFELDGEEIATVTQAPFKLQLNTDKYPHGKHTLSATARTSGGRTIESNTITAVFVLAEQGWQAAQRIMIPLFAAVGLIIVLSVVGQFVLSGMGKRRLEPSAPRNYGIAGGAICPKCGRPFALSLFSLNLITGKLARCPYCSKWSRVRPASREALAKAEAAEVEASRPSVPQLGPEEKLRQQIEESKYQ